MRTVSTKQRAKTPRPNPGNRKAQPARSLRETLSSASDTGAALWKIWFNRIFKAQSIHFYRLLGVTLFLVIFGVVMVLSASSIDSIVANNNAFTVFLKQLFFAAAGLLLMAATSIVPIKVIWGITKWFFITTLGLQILVLLIGTRINGNRNWINIFGFNLQPSEFIKLSVILFLSQYLAKQVNNFDLRVTWLRAFAIIGISMVLVLAGADMGTMLIMGIAFLGLLLLAGLPTQLVRFVAVAAIITVPILLNVGSSSRTARITAWLNPNAPDPNGYNWQSEHGIWAIAAGGPFGAGLGESKMKWSWIPEVENDFIFAIISEELGLIGALVVIALFVFLAFSLLRILQRTSDPFGRFIVGGVMIWIVFQALINIAVVLRLLPVLGVPLPLISQGGSSLVATLLAIGVVLNIERENYDARPVRSRR